MRKKTDQAALLNHIVKKRSISNALTRLLILTVMVVSFTTAGIMYYFLSQREYSQLEEKAQSFITSIDGVLGIPLWNLDRKAIIKIGRAYAHDELFEQLKIVDNMGTVCYDFERDRKAPVIRKKADIYHKGQIVGHVPWPIPLKSWPIGTRIS